MPLQPLKAYSAGSDMTLIWRQRAKLDGQLQKAHAGTGTTSLSHKLVSLSPTPSSSSSSTSTKLLQQSEKFKSERFKSDAVTQVRRLPGRCVLQLLVLLVLISQPVMSKPWSKLKPNGVSFESVICQAVPQDVLEKRVAPLLDRNLMASDMALAKKTFGSTFEDTGSTGYQGDEPDVDLALNTDDLIEDAKEWSPDNEIWVVGREADMYTENRMIEEAGDEDVWDRRASIPRKKIPTRRIPNRLSKVNNRKRLNKNKNNVDGDDTEDESESKRQTLFSDSYSYMRRRRRSVYDIEPSSRSYNQDVGNPSVDEDMEDNVNIDDYDTDEEDGDIDSKDKKSADNIQLRLFLRGKDKKTRKLLKKKLRQKARNLTKPPPWECKFTQWHKQMRTGIFPDMLLDGRCETDKCFYRLYNCEPIKYVVKLLQRDPEHCNPLPSVTNITVYEEHWKLVPYHVTVGCNCASPTIRNSKSKSRRRD